jgi:hypothetical protein
MHHVEKDVLLRSVIVIDERFRDAARLREIGNRGAKKAALRKERGRLFYDGRAAFLEIGSLRSRHGFVTRLKIDRTSG